MVFSGGIKWEHWPEMGLTVYSQKAHGHGIICKTCLKSGKFSSEWKKANLPIHKKGNKQTIKNHRPVSLLIIVRKIFEQILSNNMIEFIQKAIYFL